MRARKRATAADRQAFLARRDRMIARASPLTLVIVAASLVAFSAWDWWLDPAGAATTWPIRLVAATLILCAILPLRSGLPDRHAKTVHGVVYLVALGSVTLATTGLEQGVLWGTAGICVFPALLSYYSIPLAFYLVCNGLGLLLVLSILITAGTPSGVVANVAIYFVLMTWLGSNAALVLMRAHWRSYALERHHAEQARTDPLTGLGNRRAFDEYCPMVRERARRQGHSVWLMVLDLDHFKRVNDQYGHDVGDQVLSGAASALRARLRAGHALYRLGGEEFAAVIEARESAEVRTLAARLLDGIRDLRLDAAPELRLTISIGLARQRLGEDLVQLLRRADEAMYRAKLNGRNRVESDD